MEQPNKAVNKVEASVNDLLTWFYLFVVFTAGRLLFTLGNMNIINVYRYW